MYVENGDRRAYVSWWPKRLACRQIVFYIFEYLRKPPDPTYLQRAREYLQDLQQHPNAPLQQERIQWTQQWIRETELLLVG